METSLTTKDLEGFKEAYQKQEKYALAERTVTRNGVNAASVDDRIVRSAKPTFSIDLDAGDITNQKHSGRCWMFAGLNVLRKIALTKLNVKNLELSQPYLQFFDKLEKANCFLDRIIEQADQPTNSRENMYVFQTTIGDGGYWSNFVSLVTKYGVVPLDAMPETAVSNNTDELNVVLEWLSLTRTPTSSVPAMRKGTAERKAFGSLKKSDAGRNLPGLGYCS
jgi:bleomycin hydrolase